ncbi:MAG: type II secretion system protein [Candidatus Omnitrophota bacterium]|nr:type II secretion system protein [Candidatus Omnitrophota bacterium]
MSNARHGEGIGAMRNGFTLIEVVLGSLTLAIAVTAILGAYVGQVTLNEHARNLSLTIQDVNRVLEQIRQQNAGCAATPNAIPPAGFTSWDGWLAALTTDVPAGGGPKGLAAELIVLTCQNRTGTQYCPASQMGTAGWHAAGLGGAQDPLRITVAACWRHRNRTIGECLWDGAALSASGAGDANGNGVIESPSTLTTLVTCR